MSRAPSLTERLADLQSWRYGLSGQIARVRDFLELHDFLTPNTQSALDTALAEVNAQRITVALVAEVARGKSELINALFFADLGRRLLPSGPGKGTRCVTELRFDREVKTCVKLLPVETRESPKRFDELLADEGQWRSVLFDADSAESMARALAALSETKRISLSDAVAWGLHREGIAVAADANNATLVDVPRWRYAIINFPHPLLDAGLVIIDTPGLAAFTAEPELARGRVPNADALLMVLDITQGATKPDLAIWRDHLGGSLAASLDSGAGLRGREREDNKQTRLVILNKIDALVAEPAADPAQAARDQLHEIDLKVRDTADLLRVDPIRVIAVSAKLGLAGKLASDNDKTIKSRLYQLERGLAASLSMQRQDGLSAGILSTLSGSLESAQAALDNQRYETLEALRHLSRLRDKNEKLDQSIVSQTTTRHDQLDAALGEFRSIRTVHTRLGEELTALVDLAAAKKDAARARAIVLASKLPGSTFDAVRQYFSLTREKLDAIEAKIEEVRTLYSNIIERMQRDFKMNIADVHPFATQRFHTELQKAQSQSDAEFTKTSNLLVRRGQALAEQFDELIAKRVLHIFEIASRETGTWMRGLYVSVEKPLDALKDQTLGRIDSVEKLKSAKLDLAERIAEIQARLDVIKRKHAALADARDHLERFNRRHEDADAA